VSGLGFDDELPAVISAKAHGVIDYIHAGTNFVAAIAMRRNKRAAFSALALGINVLTNALMTDYQLGVFRAWSFRTHGRLDYGVAAASAALPTVLGFADEPEARFFHLQGTGEAAIAGLTDYNDDSGAERARLPRRRTGIRRIA